MGEGRLGKGGGGMDGGREGVSKKERKMGHPNTCILLCDYQLGMTINSELDEEGEAFFKNQAGNITEGSVVTCWGR